ncbi:MAG: molybdopterin molybdotransferase MoeA [bacterium]|nr:molybdopterin molybdotransferase MoeA [bacterium]
MTFEDAFSKVIDSVKRLPPEEVDLLSGLGCVLAGDIKARFDIPPFDKSAMDGYAVRSEDLSSQNELLCIGELPAGIFQKFVVNKGECVRIMTGSPLPSGADAVVMKEDTEEKKERIRILKPLRPLENVCSKGEDIQKGDIVLSHGSLLKAIEISLAASLGYTKVKIYRRPKVSILATGNEIIEPGEAISFGKIFNSNSYLLISILSLMKIPYTYLGIAKDNEDGLRSKIEEGLKSDLFILSGGVSVGDYDLVPKVLSVYNVKKIFHGISIKPGKPVFFGKTKKCFVFGLPGNPVSVFVGFLLFIKPALDKMMGRRPDLDIQKGRLTVDYHQKPGRKQFFPVKAIFDEGWLVTPIKDYHGSADLASLSEANGFMIADSETSHLPKGANVEFIYLQTTDTAKLVTL